MVFDWQFSASADKLPVDSQTQKVPAPMPDKNPIQHIADDIIQLRLKLPFALNHVNVYLLRGAEGWTLVDTGIHTPDGEAGWRDAFNDLDFSPGDIEKIILTHVHPDHVGMAGWLQSLAKDAGRDVPVYASEQEDRQMSLV
ncbi:MAG: MBL fold metallo-hydrolase, partial [Aggregatilineales bacterium]